MRNKFKKCKVCKNYNGNEQTKCVAKQWGRCDGDNLFSKKKELKMTETYYKSSQTEALLQKMTKNTIIANLVQQYEKLIKQLKEARIANSEAYKAGYEAGKLENRGKQ